ncbi:hypothetical protein [Flavisolibacter nicotianae]|uniref:hypothetical protein n=1 Tax=Flavisolibacter nicotianae TaxID=2364882 RepID=UPI000EB2FFD3|nr:hypothetical protein [Flavisolibacter nicotianae]
MKKGRRRFTGWVLRFAPLFSLVMGVAAYIASDELFVLFSFTGLSLVDLIVLWFVNFPVGLKMDSMGLTVQAVSLKGEQETFYLWQDIDHFRQKIVRTKQGPQLVYQAVLKNRKRVTILSFSSRRATQKNEPAINSTLQGISKKPVLKT